MLLEAKDMRKQRHHIAPAHLCRRHWAASTPCSTTQSGVCAHLRINKTQFVAHSLSCWTDRVARVVNSLSLYLSPPPTVARSVAGSGKQRYCLQLARRNQVRPGCLCCVIFDKTPTRLQLESNQSVIQPESGKQVGVMWARSVRLGLLGFNYDKLGRGGERESGERVKESNLGVNKHPSARIFETELHRKLSYAKILVSPVNHMCQNRGRKHKHTHPQGGRNQPLRQTAFVRGSFACRSWAANFEACGSQSLSVGRASLFSPATLANFSLAHTHTHALKHTRTHTRITNTIVNWQLVTFVYVCLCPVSVFLSVLPLLLCVLVCFFLDIVDVLRPPPPPHVKEQQRSAT